MDRLTRTLSGGEAQRIALSNALGSHLVDTLYVLDEPSIGLHPADVDRLLALLRQLATAGNTVVVVEHDPAAMRAADWMVELGPASGEAGGQLVYQGPAAAVREAGTLTGQYLSGDKRIGVPSARRPAVRWLELKGARLHNLAGVDVRIPLGTLTVVTGVSGSGKSTLVHDVLYRQLEFRLRGEHTAKQHLGEPVGAVTALKGWEHLEDVVLIDQAPIGRTPRSNPVTYVKAFDELRALFAKKRWRARAATRPARSRSTSPAGAAKPARAPDTCSSRWCFSQTCSYPVTSAAASGSSGRYSTSRCRAPTSRKRSSGRWTRRCSASTAIRGSLAVCGICSKWDSGICAWGSPRRRSRVVRPSA
jgi:excinuclease ABC subunit A